MKISAPEKSYWIWPGDRTPEWGLQAPRRWPWWYGAARLLSQAPSSRPLMQAHMHSCKHGSFVLLPPGTPSFWISTVIASDGAGGGGRRRGDHGQQGWGEKSLDGGRDATVPFSLSRAADPDSFYPQRKVLSGLALLRILYTFWKRI